MKVEEFQYDDKIVRKFVVATVVWGIIPGAITHFGDVVSLAGGG